MHFSKWLVQCILPNTNATYENTSYQSHIEECIINVFLIQEVELNVIWNYQIMVIWVV